MRCSTVKLEWKESLMFCKTYVKKAHNEHSIRLPRYRNEIGCCKENVVELLARFEGLNILSLIKFAGDSH